MTTADGGERCVFCRGAGEMVAVSAAYSRCNHCGAKRVGDLWTWRAADTPKVCSHGVERPKPCARCQDTLIKINELEH